MALQFRKRVKILPGLTLNFSQSGISTSVGTKGARMTFGKRGVTTSVGIPGTGIYDRTTHSWGTKGQRRGTPTQIAWAKRYRPAMDKLEEIEKRVAKAASAGELWKMQDEARQLIEGCEQLAESLVGVYGFGKMRQGFLQEAKELRALLDALPPPAPGTEAEPGSREKSLNLEELAESAHAESQRKSIAGRWLVVACLFAVILFGSKFAQEPSSASKASQTEVSQVKTYKLEDLPFLGSEKNLVHYYGNEE